MPTPKTFQRMVAYLCWCALALTALTQLTGCGAPKLVQASKGEVVTESDEPEFRKRARIRLELAVSYFNNGQTTDALDHLKQSIAADPNFFDAYNLRGLIYMRLNDFALAEEAFRHAAYSGKLLMSSY